MKKKSFIQFIILTLIINLFCGLTALAQTATQPSSGDGTEGNPYQIATLDNLYWLSQNSSEWSSGKYFLQTADIDASSTSGWDNGQGFSPIGNDSVNFKGIYNGNGHVITGLFIARGAYTGLFGYAVGGEIKNLAITDVNISGSYRVGALVGLTYSNVTNCYSTGTVSGNYAGGLIGESRSADISSGFSTCSVSGANRVGGFIGYMDSGTIKNCYSKGDVTRTSGNSVELGGFCGTTVWDVVIEKCYSTGQVTYENGNNPHDKGFIGEVTNGDNASFTANYFDSNTSHQSSGPTNVAARMLTIDMINTKTYTKTNSWDFVNNPNNDHGNEDIWGINPRQNDGYPFLMWSGYTNYLKPPANGNGTSDSPYLITDLQDLYWLSQVDIDGKFMAQTTDIDATQTINWCGGEGFIPIGTDYYKKVSSINYNGNNHTINGLVINRYEAYCALFGYVENGIIKNLQLSNINIEGRGFSAAMVGSLSGSNSVISNCSATGTVTGESNVGGLVGRISTSVTVKNSYSTCSVTGTNQTGGFFGYSYFGIVKNCYSKGNVTRTNSSSLEAFGGFGGYVSDAIIENCYSTGSVSYAKTTNPTNKGFLGGHEGQITFTANFFDSETSEQSSDASGAATAKTSNEMKNYNTFTAAGWDFVDETDNGTNDYWDADQNQTVNNGYVILAWQSGADNTLPVELTTFTANVKNNIVILNWQTATEVNNHGFEIERSLLSASTWYKIGFAEGHGNSNTPNHYSFTDNNVTAGKYLYRLKQIDIDGSFEYSKSIEVEIATPNSFSLEQNYPNPFNPTTTIKYSLPLVATNELPQQNVTLKVYDVLGNKVATLVDKKQKPGNYSIKFNAKNLSSGIYFYKLQAGDFVQTKKLMLMK